MIASEAVTQICVGIGSSDFSPGFSSAICSKMPTKTGITKATTATSTTIAKPKISAGYISADFTCRRRPSVFSTW